MLKIYCGGSEGYINQIDRIRAGFIENSCELVSLEEADLIYFNDPNSYDLAAKSKNPKAKVIFNVLDYPVHLINESKWDLSRWPRIYHPYPRDFDIEKLTKKLQYADIVTTICDEVTFQAKYFSNISAHTIFNPVKPVSFLNLTDEQKVKNKKGENYKYLFIGRVADMAKRANLMIEALNILGELDKLAIIGSESIGYGDYFGVLNDEGLNLMLNSVEYLFLPSIFKSVSLPGLEAVISHVKPIVCSDDLCSNEFFGDLGLEPNSKTIANAIKSEEWNKKADEFIKNRSEEYKIKFSSKQIAQNILDLV